MSDNVGYIDISALDEEVSKRKMAKHLTLYLVGSAILSLIMFNQYGLRFRFAWASFLSLFTFAIAFDLHLYPLEIVQNRVARWLE